MPLTAGIRVGPYEILAPLGEGGMGEVYRARDARLNRDVALKVLPETFARDGDRMERFEREAQVLASLNHPSIGALYGLEDFNGARALVLELVEGATLAGPLPIDRALPIARQIAEAMEYAHDRGIIHRDLKPANVKVTAEGVVKVLDFGLAKALDESQTANGGENSPTISLARTRVGVILGTAAYMSPEQASGKPMDKRSDIWSFGVLLWEMLSGERLFRGETVSETLADVLRAEIDWTRLPAETPPVIRELLRRCLDRDVKSRLRDIGEARIVIQTYLSQPSGATALSDNGTRVRLSWLPWAIAGVAVAGALAGVVLLQKPPPKSPVIRFQIHEPEKTRFGVRLTLSPDGRRLAFTAIDADRATRVWVRSLDSLEARPLVGTEEAISIFWSPDSRFIGFWALGKLKKIEVSGGPPQTLCDAPVAPGGTWNRNGVILFGSAVRGVYRVPDTGGVPVVVTELDASLQERAHTYPYFLPDGKHFLYHSRSSQPNKRAIYLASIDSKDRKQLVDSTVSGVYAPSTDPTKGHLLFLRDGILMAQPFDSARLDFAGDAAPIAGHVSSFVSQPFLSASTNELLAYRTGGGQASQLTWLDREGKSFGPAGPAGSYHDQSVDLSADGTVAAVSRMDSPDSAPDIWLIDLLRGVPTRLNFNPAADQEPVWFADGTRVAFSSNRDGRFKIYQKAASGAGNEELLLDSGAPKDLSRDGRFLLLTRSEPDTQDDLWVLNLGTGPGVERKATPYLRTQANETHGQFSPDGRFVAYTSNESGQYEVYVQPFPATGGKWLISDHGGTQPRWRRDSKELFYISPAGQLMSAEIRSTLNFERGVPKQLFQTRMSGIANFIPGQLNYGVSADGKRFLVNTEAEQVGSFPITVVVNWTAAFSN